MRIVGFLGPCDGLRSEPRCFVRILFEVIM